MILREEIIGNSRLLLGDCLRIIPMLEPVSHVISDPPYEDELHAAVGKIRRKDGQHMPKTLGFDGINNIRAEATELMIKISRGWLLVFTLAEGVREWRDEIQKSGGKYDTCLAWIKRDSMPRFNGQGASRGFECIVTAWCGDGYRSWNGGGSRGIFDHLVNPPTRDGRHSTEKPLSLMRELVALYTNRGDTVLDPFAGSGSTGVACVQTGREFIGIERDEKFFDVMCDRIKKAHQQGDLFTEIPKATQIKLF